MSVFERFKSFLHRGKLDVQARFDLLREAVTGSMSSFYVARDRQSDQVVGLKILDPQKTDQFESRFTGLGKPSEGEISSKFSHPNIVSTLEYGLTNKDEPYLVMEYLNGDDLNRLMLSQSQRLKKFRLTLLRQMAEALATVHDLNFIHRDICPRNFICLEQGRSLKLIDFGLSVPATEEFTRPGNRTGTVNYMAPEIIRRRTTDHRVDIFALGVTAYQLLTFELPWPTHDMTGQAALLHDTQKPIDILLHRPHLSPRLAKLVTACLEADPTRRPQTVTEFLRGLRGVSDEEG